MESKVVRIVNLDESLTEDALKNLILVYCRPLGAVEKIYLKRDDEIKKSYAYVVFRYSDDALKVTQILNEHVYNTNIFEVELIGPNLKYQKYGIIEDRPLNLMDRYRERMRQIREIASNRQTAALNSVPIVERRRPVRVNNGRAIPGLVGIGSKFIPPHIRNGTNTSTDMK